MAFLKPVRPMQKPARSKGVELYLPLLRAGFCISSRIQLKFAIVQKQRFFVQLPRYLETGRFQEQILQNINAKCYSIV